MSVANWLTLAGLIITNVLVIGPMVTKWFKGRAQSDAMVPLKYFEQIQKEQADYIMTVEQRATNASELYRQSEARNAVCEQEVEDLKRRLARTQALLEDYMRRVHEKGDPDDYEEQPTE